MRIFLFSRVENNVEKGENTFGFFFPPQKQSFTGLLKAGLCGKGINAFCNS